MILADGEYTIAMMDKVDSPQVWNPPLHQYVEFQCQYSGSRNSDKLKTVSQISSEYGIHLEKKSSAVLIKQYEKETEELYSSVSGKSLVLDKYENAPLSNMVNIDGSFLLDIIDPLYRHNGRTPASPITYFRMHFLYFTRPAMTSFRELCRQLKDPKNQAWRNFIGVPDPAKVPSHQSLREFRRNLSGTHCHPVDTKAEPPS